MDPLSQIRTKIGRNYSSDAEVFALIDRENVDRKGSHDRTALLHAAIWGRTELAKTLLDLGAQVNIQDGNGMAALHFAVQQNHPNIVQLLLDRGAKVDLKDRHGNTPLWRAVFEKRLAPIAELLFRYGASPDSHNIYGKSPRDMVEGYKEHGEPLLALFRKYRK